LRCNIPGRIINLLSPADFVIVPMGCDFRRRELLWALGSVAAWSVASHAQQARMRVIGLVGGASAASQAAWSAAFVRELRARHWVEGKNIAIEYRWLEGRLDRAPDVISELIDRKVDIIVTHSTPLVLIAKKLTPAIPIVFASAGDPVGNGMVASLARPGGNLTGLSVQSADLAGKHVEFLQNLIPNLRHFTFLYHVGNAVTKLQLEGAKAAATTLKIGWSVAEIRGPDDVVPTIESLRGRTEALIVPSTPVYNAMRKEISSAALRAKLPTIYFDRMYVQAGGLMSYGPNWPSMWERAAVLVDHVLKGEKPADIPVQQPPQFDLVVNLKTARALGITLPRLLEVRATELIE
jgi:putative ABC transport system substrate-binding protein